MKRNIIIIVIMLASANIISAGQQPAINVGGTFIGITNFLKDKDSNSSTPKRQQFDLGVNIDLIWQIRPTIRGVVQLQSGPGEGSLGFAGPEAVVTDLNIELDLSNNFMLTAGSFDTPLGIETSYLTNNGDGFANAFLLNTLFYSAIAGTHVGTLNTVGLKGDWSGNIGDITVAFTNGTDESATNPDGNFEYVFTYSNVLESPNIELGVSFIQSVDSSKSGQSGLATDFSGWTAGVRYFLTKQFYLDGYWGQFTFDDHIENTQDNLLAWKLEASYQVGKYYLAGRISTWQPDESAHISSAIYNPGLTMGNFNPSQSVQRFQMVWGWYVNKDMVLKVEGISDRYLSNDYSKATNTTGGLLSLNVRF